VPILPGRKSAPAFKLIPGTITAISPDLLCLTDGATTPVKVFAGKGWTPAINDRVGLIPWGTNYLVLSVLPT
jgi:hypothetical protein